MKTVGDRIREKREELGMTQEELSKKLGYKSRSSVNKMENARELPLKKVTMMADVLGCSPSYLMGWDEESNVQSTLSKSNVDLFSGVGGLKKGISPNTVCIQLADEPEIHMHSKFAYDLVKMMKDMSEEDLEFLANTAQRISPKPKKPKKVIVVENTANQKENDITDIKNVVPFPQYPSVTNKDIDEFAARNKKNKFTREEIAEKLYEMDKED